MTRSPFETAETFRSPTVRQLSVFLEDRVGALLRLFQAFEGSSVRVVAMSVVHAIDCAIVRLICDDNEKAIEILHTRGFPYPLLTRPTGRAAIAVHTDSMETAVQVLKSRKFEVLREEDLGPGSVR
jgi:hypothetical protein